MAEILATYVVASVCNADTRANFITKKPLKKKTSMTVNIMLL